MRLIEKRVCPICGHAVVWAYGLVWHQWDEVKIVHVKFRNEFKPGRVVEMASLLRNGIAVRN